MSWDRVRPGLYARHDGATIVRASVRLHPVTGQLAWLLRRRPGSHPPEAYETLAGAMAAAAECPPNDHKGEKGHPDAPLAST